MYSQKEYSEIIESAINSIEFPSEPEGLYAPIKYALQCGGKRLRPMLTLAFAQAFYADPRSAVNQAIGLEMFHNFTLLHDDVMDNADVRRGRPTVHKKWNVATAILSGDAMLTLSSMIALKGCDDSVRRSVFDLFNRTAMEVYKGQQYDMDFENCVTVTVDEYMEMIRLKTSVLLGCACRMGALVAGADEASQKLAYAYGEKLGLAFQLVDDYLDTYGDPVAFGKAIGGDILNDKKTWLLINALIEDETDEVKSQISSPTDDKIERVRGVYDRLNLPERCLKLANAYVDDAIAGLYGLDIPDDARRFFIEIAEKSRTRTH